MAVDIAHERHLIGEISVGAVEHNLSYLRGLVAPDCAIWPVVKANAYGLGLEQLWPVLEAGSDGLCVSNFREALELRRWGYAGPLLILFPVGAISPADNPVEVLARLIAEAVELTVASTDEISRVVLASSVAGCKARLHLKIDSGMHRGGAPMADASSLLAQIRSSDQLDLAGVYTHFATAEDPSPEFARLQLDRFLGWVAASRLEPGVALHAANSAALLELVDSHLTRVRPGLSVYGCLPARHLDQGHALRPAFALKSHLMQIKPVAEGDGCGYGLTYRFEHPSRIGLVPIGYADGYLRALGNRAAMRVRGREVPVRGTIAMDQTIVDLAQLPQACVGDEVEIIAADITAANSVEELARLAGTIPYEILTRLGSRIEPLALAILVAPHVRSQTASIGPTQEPAPRATRVLESRGTLPDSRSPGPSAQRAGARGGASHQNRSSFPDRAGLHRGQAVPDGQPPARGGQKQESSGDSGEGVFFAAQDSAVDHSRREARDAQSDAPHKSHGRLPEEGFRQERDRLEGVPITSKGFSDYRARSDRRYRSQVAPSPRIRPGSRVPR
jgi:alanine racemase